MYEFLAKGGVVMIPIFACSVVAVAIFFERMWILRRGRIIPRAFFHQVERLIRERRVQEAMGACQANTSSLARVLLAGLKHYGRERGRMKEAIVEVAEREASELERFIEALGTISSVSTLLGLLGTISGMIKIFSVISTQAVVNPPSLAAGISEALITTFAGLTVAIPALVMYKYLQSRVDSLLRQLEEYALALLDLSEGEGREWAYAVS